MLKKSIYANELENTVGGKLYVFTEADGTYIEILQFVNGQWVPTDAVIIPTNVYRRLTANPNPNPNLASQVAANFINARANRLLGQYADLNDFIAQRNIDPKVNHRIVDVNNKYVL